jgi:serine/threonine protein kinase
MTAEELIELAKKSGVVDEKRLNALVDKLRAASAMPTEPGKLAGILVRDGVLTHFQAEQFLLGRWRRFTIGKYKVLERLGKGGMGSVYLCEHKFMRRRAAVKVLPVAKAEDPSSLERFYREARAVAALDHPNIVRAYDIDHEDDLHFLVMEYVEGSSLQEIVKKHGPMDIARACHYTRQAAIGLQHAHKTAGLVHRDIKPGNILVDRTGVVKILDMGLARFFHDEEDVLTKKYDENVLGTADYLAPEQALDSHGVDIRADIYSLGATFYFILTGSTPFSEGTVAQKLIWHQTRQPKPVRIIRPELPEGLAALIEKMMAKDPAQRYQTPADVVEALVPFTQQPIPPPPEHEMPRLSLAATGAAGMPDSGLSATGSVPGMPSPVPNRQAGPPSPAPFRPSSLPPKKSTPDISAGAGEPAPTLPIPYLGKKSNQGLAAGAKPEPFPLPAAAPKAGGFSVDLGRPGLATPVQNPQVEDSDVLPWERLTPDTDNPIARADTALGASRSGLTSSLGFRNHPHFWWIVIGGTALVSGVAILLLWVLAHVLPAPSTNTKSSVPSPQTFLVTAQTEKPNSFFTIREALKQARPGDRILVQKDTHEEQLLLEEGRWGNGVTIEGQAPNGTRVVWRIPKDVKDKRTRFIDLSKTEDLHLKGFTLDGEGRVEDLVVLFGHCPGLTLEDIHFQGFKRCAVNVFHCAGKPEKPVSFVGLRAVAPGERGATAPGANPEAALIFSFRDNILDPKENQYIHVQDCLFAGPYQAAVLMAGPELDLEFAHNRFYGADCGIRFKEAKQISPVRVTLANNTFCNLKTALEFESLPLVEEKPEENRIVLEKNLFAQTAVVAKVDKPLGKDRSAKGETLQSLASQLFQFCRGNVRDPSSQDGNIMFEILSVPFPPLPQDPNDDKKFLRYPKDSPLVDRGSPGIVEGD